jgi:hypothetical protein
MYALFHDSFAKLHIMRTEGHLLCDKKAALATIDGGGSRVVQCCGVDDLPTCSVLIFGNVCFVILNLCLHCSKT